MLNWWHWYFVSYRSQHDGHVLHCIGTCWTDDTDTSFPIAANTTVMCYSCRMVKGNTKDESCADSFSGGTTKTCDGSSCHKITTVSGSTLRSYVHMYRPIVALSQILKYRLPLFRQKSANIAIACPRNHLCLYKSAWRYCKSIYCGLHEWNVQWLY